MPKRLIFVLPVAVIALFLLGKWAVSSYKSAEQRSRGTFPIVASTNVWGDIAQQIGGDHVTVTSILRDPSTDPHLYEADASSASKVSSAYLVITNGLGYDEFMDKLLAASYETDRSVLTVASVLHAKEGDNPHFWYDLERIPQIATSIEQQLVKQDPLYRADYETNLNTFLKSYQPVLQQVASLKKFSTVDVSYTERLPEYLFKNLALVNKTPSSFAASVEAGSEPSPAELNEFLTIIRSKSIKVLFYNNQVSNHVTEQLKQSASEAGVSVVGISETIPAGQSFQDWQLGQLQAFQRGLSQ